jgi:hypothetical protein
MCSLWASEPKYWATEASELVEVDLFCMGWKVSCTEEIHFLSIPMQMKLVDDHVCSARAMERGKLEGDLEKQRPEILQSKPTQSDYHKVAPRTPPFFH